MARGLHRAAALLPALFASGGALGDGISGLIEEDVARSRIETTDQGGTSRFDATLFTQRYRLALERTIFPNLRFATGGVYERVIGNSQAAGESVDQASRIASFFANLNLSSQLVGGSAGYTRREALAPGTLDPFVYEEPSIALSWRPLELPALTLRLSHPSTWDKAKEQQDVSTDQAIATAQYTPFQHVDLRYAFDYSHPTDHLHSTETTAITQTGGINYGETFGSWGTTVAAGINVISRRTSVTSAGAGGNIATQLFPVGAFSVVEVFPAVPSQDNLTVNQALIDGNLTATAGLNLGYSAITPTGEANLVDLAVQLPDSIAKLNTVFVWVDRPVPQDVAARFTFTAWRSEDNVHWTQVAVLGKPNFPLFQNRFEVTIEETAARFVKVVVAPIARAAAGNDPRFSDILVTEVQVYEISSVVVRGGWQSTATELLTAGLRTQILGRSDLAYDFSLSASRAQEPDAGAVVTYLVANGLSYGRKLGPIFLVGARVARQDLDQSRGHEVDYLYSASLTADELPTLGHTLSYSGQANLMRSGNASTNSLSFLNRATPYRGIALLAGASWNIATAVTGQTTKSNVITVNATVQPNQALTLGGTYGRTGTVLEGGDQATQFTRTQRIEGTFSFSPFPALYLAGGATRVLSDVQGYTLANAALGFSPFAGGALQLTFNFNQSLDSNGAVTRLVTPGLRWNINRSTVLTATYSLVDTTGGPEQTHTRTFDINLKVPL